MNRESIELRIDELNLQKKVLLQKARNIKKQIDQMDGAIAEMWKWLDAWKEKGEYGYRTIEDGVKVMKVPKFKTQEEIQRALEGKPAAIGGIPEGAVLDAREDRARYDAQQAVSILDGQSPYEDKDADTG